MIDAAPEWPLIFPAALLLLLLILFLARLWRSSNYPYSPQNTLLSATELAFFKALSKAVTPEQLIAPKVRLGDVIGCSEEDWARGHGPRISAKHLDFVIIDRDTSKILFAVELDDKSHDRPERRKRDDFLNKALKAANVPLLRIPASRSYTVADIRLSLKDISLLETQPARRF